MRWLAILCLLLGACSSSSDDFQLLRAALQRPATDPRFEALRSQPTAHLEVALLEQDRSGTLLLEGTRDGITTWLSAEGASLLTQAGMLVGTRGFGQGLMASDVAQSRALIAAGQPGTAERFHSYLTGDDQIVTRTYRCAISDRGARTLNGNATRLIAEDCLSLTDQFLNLYWIDPGTGQIRQARQWPGPALGVVILRETTP